MKRIVAAILVFFLCNGSAFAEQFNFEGMSLDELLACQTQLEEAIALAEEDEIIIKAMDVLLEYWKTEEYQSATNFSETGYLEIIKTRVVYISEEASQTEYFQDMLCFVEFNLLSDYLGTAPYYFCVGKNECVAFYKDGTFGVCAMNPLNSYRGRTFNTDFSNVIKSISDRGSEFNNSYQLLVE